VGDFHHNTYLRQFFCVDEQFTVNLIYIQGGPKKLAQFFVRVNFTKC